MREARRALLSVACAMTRASACGSSWLSVESRRVALATIATPSRADAPRRRPVAAVRHATAAEAPATHWAGRQKARAALASATRLMSESDRASFAAYDVEFVVEISRCRAPLHRSTSDSHRPAPDVWMWDWLSYPLLPFCRRSKRRRARRQQDYMASDLAPKALTMTLDSYGIPRTNAFMCADCSSLVAGTLFRLKSKKNN